jgi:hypothetical protein
MKVDDESNIESHLAFINELSCSVVEHFTGLVIDGESFNNLPISFTVNLNWEREHKAFGNTV